ncbi:MAG: radical SAM protein [Deltaproteobacteria bacterium]|nr:radical SAM protein [Deltaproteobacteria bacterium]
MKIFVLNTPEETMLVSRDMAGGLGFDRNQAMVLPPLDLLTFATVLGQAGHQVRFCDAQTQGASASQLTTTIAEFAPDALILSASLPSLSSDAAYAKKLRDSLGKRCRVLIKTSIAHPPALEQLCQQSACDLVITGECDLVIEALIFGHSTAGTARLEGGELRLEPETPLRDLDRLPILQRSLLDSAAYRYARLGAGVTTMQTSRGCPFPCGYYCPYPLVQGKKWRAMSARRVLDELEQIARNDHIEKVLFRDAVFTLNKRRTAEICAGIIERGIALTWWCETRVDCLDPPLLDQMRAAGCAGINIGIESGAEWMLSGAAHKDLSRAEIVELAHHCKTRGIRLHLLLLAGLPGEDRRSLHQTFTLIDQTKPESIGITTATPYPGTQLFDDAVAQNWIVRPEFDSFGGHGYNLQLETIAHTELKWAIEMMHTLCRANNDGAPQQRLDELRRQFADWSDAGEQR